MGDEFNNQYQAALTASAVLPRDSRGLLEIAGEDRAKWLSNLVTNVVATLKPGDGNYAFVVNVKGRTQFDLNILVRPDRILLDIDRRWIDKAAPFLDRYIITEKVTITNRTTDAARLAIVGPTAHEIVSALGLGANLTAMAWLQNVETPPQATSFAAAGDADGAGNARRAGNSQGTGNARGAGYAQDAGGVAPANSRCHDAALLFRHDFTGLPGAEIITFGPTAALTRDQLIEAARSHGATVIDPAVAETLRIEAGLPASVDDIDDDVIPPETGQIERGISYHKGCYLGQEVIERMRAHKVLARKLVGVKFDSDSPTARGEATVIDRHTPLFVDESEIGRTMSGCFSPALEGAPLSLAYIKTAVAKPGTAVAARTPQGARRGQIIELPVRKASPSA